MRGRGREKVEEEVYIYNYKSASRSSKLSSGAQLGNSPCRQAVKQNSYRTAPAAVTAAANATSFL